MHGSNRRPERRPKLETTMAARRRATPLTSAREESFARDPGDSFEMKALLLVGHGTRDPAGVAEFLELSRKVAARFDAANKGHTVVEPCFLEHASPTIERAMESLATRGVTRFVVAPVMLFAAGHVLEDIPARVEKAAKQWAFTEFGMSRHLGLQRSIIELSVHRYVEATRGQRHGNPETMLLLVGRGSREPSANAEWSNFAGLRVEAMPTGRWETCSIALTPPLLAEMSPILANSPFPRIVVQPHLLFRGELVEKVRREVAGWRAALADRTILVTEPLGPHRLIAEAILDSADLAFSAGFE